jgi:hypothetical protein
MAIKYLQLVKLDVFLYDGESVRLQLSVKDVAEGYELAGVR